MKAKGYGNIVGNPLESITWKRFKTLLYRQSVADFANGLKGQAFYMSTVVYRIHSFG